MQWFDLDGLHRSKKNILFLNMTYQPPIINIIIWTYWIKSIQIAIFLRCNNIQEVPEYISMWGLRLYICDTSCKTRWASLRFWNVFTWLALLEVSLLLIFWACSCSIRFLASLSDMLNITTAQRSSRDATHLFLVLIILFLWLFLWLVLQASSFLRTCTYICRIWILTKWASNRHRRFPISPSKKL